MNVTAIIQEIKELLQDNKEQFVDSDDCPDWDDGTHTEVLSNGTRVWKNQDGWCHRDGDKPAVIFADGSKEWWKNGEEHRDGDKPAIVYVDGDKEWYKNGQRHRDGDKPAIVWADGHKQWWIDGKFIKQEKPK